MKNILIAEDGNNNYFLLETLLEPLLENKNINLIRANNRKEVLDLFNNNILFIIMDIKMPEMDGIKCTNYIRNILNNKDIIIVAHTAYIDLLNYEELGFNDVLNKPIFYEKLEQIINKYIK